MSGNVGNNLMPRGGDLTPDFSLDAMFTTSRGYTADLIFQSKLKKNKCDKIC